MRKRSNPQPVSPVFPEPPGAGYLVSTYMPHAVVDWSLSEVIPVAQDRRTIEDPRRRQAYDLFAQSTKKNAEISSITGAHRNSIGKWRKEWKASQAA